MNEWKVKAWTGDSRENKPFVAVDSASRIYATDPEGYRVLIFSNMGDYLGRFGTFGTDLNSFGLPNGIAIDSEDNIYIADAANHRILKFAPIFGGIQFVPVEDGADSQDEAESGIDDVDDGAGEEGVDESNDPGNIAPDAGQSEETGQDTPAEEPDQDE